VYPVWTIIGPGSSLVLTNLTTNRTLTVNATVAAGDSIVIDTRPGQKSVRRGDGTNLLSSLVGDPELWSLTESVNQVSAVLTGAIERLAGRRPVPASLCRHLRGGSG
jgi:hypothetical protein